MGEGGRGTVQLTAEKLTRPPHNYCAAADRADEKDLPFQNSKIRYGSVGESGRLRPIMLVTESWGYFYTVTFPTSQAGGLLYRMYRCNIGYKNIH